MEFLSFDSKTKSLTLKKSDVPVPVDNQILIKVSYSGICGTDLHIIEGSFPCKDGTFTLGHEFSGIVEAIGPTVRNFSVGQKVAVNPNDGCNTCNHCHGGNYHFCANGAIHNTIGIFRDGGWSTHALVQETQVFPLPDGVDLAQAALAEPLSCLAHGWDRINPVDVGTRTLVIGAGIIGSLWSSFLHLRGLRKTVVVSEPQAKRRELFENLNLDYEAVSPSDLEGREFELAIDCSGSAPAMEAALRLLGPGGRLCVFGVANPQAEVTFKPFEVYMNELTIYGVIINQFAFPKALSLLSAMGDRYLNYEKLGIRVFKLTQYEEALSALKNGEIKGFGSAVRNFSLGQKVVVDPNCGCTVCDFCHSGNYHFCRDGGIDKTVGIYRDGGWSTHAVVPESQVYLVPDGVDLAQAALVEPLSCLAHGWDRIDPVHVGTRTLVIGAGIIGSLWSSLLHLRGQRKTVTISEPVARRRELFENLNLDYKAVSPSELKGREFDLVIDCSGSAPAIEAAVPLLGKGGRLCVFGVANPQAEVKIKPFDIYIKELSILGVNINPFTFPKALSLTTAMGDTYLNYEKLGIGVYRLAEHEKALTALKTGDISKAVFKL